MKATFSGPASRTVALKHGEEVVEIRLTALPMGYSAYLERVYPQPHEFVNGEKRPNAAAAQEWRYDQNIIAIAKAMGDQVDAAAPAVSTPDAWATYAKALRAEFTDAGMDDHDYVELYRGLAALHQGSGEPGKSS